MRSTYSFKYSCTFLSQSSSSVRRQGESATTTPSGRPSPGAHIDSRHPACCLAGSQTLDSYRARRPSTGTHTSRHRVTGHPHFPAPFLGAGGCVPVQGNRGSRGWPRARPAGHRRAAALVLHLNPDRSSILPIPQKSQDGSDRGPEQPRHARGAAAFPLLEERRGHHQLRRICAPVRRLAA